MKILSENSVFKKLPIEMQGYQLLIMDAIRITFEMIEYNYESLEIKLHTLSQENPKKKNVSHIFNDAWGIIDNTSRVIKLLKKIPSKSEHKILDEISYVNSFRNTLQHLDERIDESMIGNKSPFYGILIWYHKNLITGKLTPKIIISGIVYGFSVDYKVPNLGESIKEVNDIFIQTVDKKKTIVTNLSELIRNLKTICESNEKILENFFKTQGWNLCDWTARQDIMISLTNENEEKEGRY